MSVQHRRVFCTLFLLASLLLSGCLGDSKTEPTQSLDKAYTQAAETIAAELTRNAPATPADVTAEAMAIRPTATIEVLPPTSTPLPTDTLFPTDTPLPTNTPIPTNTPVPTVPPSPTLPPGPTFTQVFSDDFSFTGQWPIEKEDDFYFHYTQGGYMMENRVVNDLAYSVRSDQYVDVAVEVQGARVKGPLDGYYGVICRFADGRNYYALVAGSDGQYAIIKKSAGVITFLAVGDDTVGAVYTGNAPNVVRGECVKDALTLYVNGIKLLTAQDYEFSAGAAGLVVGTRKASDYIVLFDNYFVYEP
ncbi:MAG: hypothetical protein JXB15_14510 [Anaerolineales bacterium]|nr:hypothetical protein [Anaerolineales bacterium]